MSTTPRKKLIEVSIPLEAINNASAREKSIRHGHPWALHMWWARRPLAACRAVLFAQLVDDPSAWPEKYPTEVAQEKERLRLHGVIERMVRWEASNDQAILNEARWEIARSIAWGLDEEPPEQGNGKAIVAYLQQKAPPVYDPFSGGGSIPLEAQRLGLRAYGSDLNPVAVLIGRAQIDVPHRFAGMPPINPKSQATLQQGGHWQGNGAQGLAEDVRYYGDWMLEEAAKRIQHLYPKARLDDGSEATVIAWLWARTVRSPDPAAKGAMVPLISSFILSGKEGKKAWVEPILDADAPDGWRFEVRSGALGKANEEELRNGTKSSRGNFRCILTGTAISEAYNRAQGAAGLLGQRMIAIVADGPKGRAYVTPRRLDEVAAAVPSPHSGPEGELYAKALGFRVPAYGMKLWRDLYSDRQLTVLNTFAGLVSDARDQVLQDLSTTDSLSTGSSLEEGGSGREAYADAVATYLAFMVNQMANHSSTLCGWNSANAQMRSVFSKQALSMTWDFAEANLLSGASGSFGSLFDRMTKAFEGLPKDVPPGRIENAAAQSVSVPAGALISTDPPYYDNIGYADLSDFYYSWLRITLSGVWPKTLRRIQTPKDEELVATPHRHGGAALAQSFFMDGMRTALTSMMADAGGAEPIGVYYAFKQSEVSSSGTTSAGWASFLQAIVDSGLLIDGTWPLDTEKKGRTRDIGTNALASSILLSCRRRPPAAAITDRAGFTSALRRELPDAIAMIRNAGISPVDMQQSVIGPGMGVFTRFAEVLDDDDQALPVKTALVIINRVWQEIDSELLATFDAETQVALAWFASYGFDTRTSGELIGIATAKDTAIGTLFASGVFQNLHGKAALTPRDQLPADWTPSRDRHLTVWECVQHAARVLNSPEGGAAAAGRLVAEMGPVANDARALIDRLFQIATEKGWAQEALVYNQLAEEWPHMLEQADSAASDEATAATTGDLFS